MDLQEELESNIEKTSDISADLRYLMLQDIGKEGIGQYEQDMAAMGEEDEDLITHTRAAMANGPEGEVTLHTPPAEISLIDD